MYFIKQILNTVSNSAIANTIYHSEVFSFLKGCKQSESIIFCGICTMYIIIGLDNASVFGIEGKMTLKSQQILLFQEAGRMLWWTDVKMLVYLWSAELSDLWSLVFDCWLVDGLWSLIVGQLGQQVIFPLECCPATPPTRLTAVEISFLPS